MDLNKLILIIAPVFLCVALPGSSVFGQNIQGVPFDGQPNIVLINLDDADSDLLSPQMLQSFYPNMRRMAQQGLRFTNLHATTPFCAPSRAALFRGQYAFNTGIKVNNVESPFSNGFSGGYGEFVRRGYDNDELGVWMKNAGYRTMHVGKFHHHGFDGRVPPGWDDFRMTAGARYFASFRFSNQNDATGEWFQTTPNDYITTVDTNDAVDLIARRSGSPQPFFLYVAPIAPHASDTFVPEDMVEPRYTNFAAGHSLPASPDLHEQDVSDKPRHLRFVTPGNWRQVNRRSYISRVRAVKSIDDMVGRIFDAIDQIGATNNTYVILTSDNGFQLGHHNIQNKTDPYNRTTNVPLLVTGPGVPANQTAGHLLAHIDICPTILNLARTGIPASVDAKSFFPLLFNPQVFSQENWQEGIMIENWAKKLNFNRSVVGSYVAYRKHHEVFVSWANGQYEYYNLNNDPYQLDNVFSSLPVSQKQNLKREVRRFRVDQIEPITTLDKVYQTKLQTRNVKLRGYAEDDAGVFGTLVTMKSTTTDRFWNGEAWQDDWYGHFLAIKNTNQPISVWNFKTRVQTETASGFDYIVFTYRSLDSDGVLPHTVSFHVNEIDGKSPVAAFSDYVNLPVFDQHVDLSGTYFDGVEFDRATITIRDTATGKYWNGTQFQSHRTNFSAELQTGSDWQFTLDLPAGRYLAGVRGIDAAGNRQHPADTLRFRVR